MAPPTSPSRTARVGPTLLALALLASLGLVGAWSLARVDVPMLTGRVPAVAHDAYRVASLAAPSIGPSCEVDWTILAGIGQVESRHGRMSPQHRIADGGDVSPPIRGRPLNGLGGTQTIPDTDGGHMDGDSEWDRAMGPLQFIPTTWAELGRDGNGDGLADPDNLYDAAVTAVAHLCLRQPGDYAQPPQLRRALIGYNASGPYADEVLEWIDRYRSRPLEEVVDRGSR